MVNIKQRSGAMEYLTCGAKAKKGPCKLPAGYRTDHPGFGTCSVHCGSTPAVSKAAYRAEALAMAEELRLANKIEGTSPHDALLAEIARGAGAVAYFDALVAQIPHEADAPLTPRNSALIQLWNEQRLILAKVSSVVIKAGIEERMVKVVEVQAAALVTAIMTVLTDPTLALQPEQIAMGKQLMAGQLRALSSG